MIPANAINRCKHCRKENVMLVGIPKEIKNHEYRVGLTPAGVRELVANGNQVLVETGAGKGIGFEDADYTGCGADIAQMLARRQFLNAQPHTLKCDCRQAMRLNIGLSNEEHAARVAVKTFFDDRDVDIDRIAALQCLIARYSVADHVIYRGADRFGEAAIVERRWNGVLNVCYVCVANTIKLIRCYAGLYIISNHIKDICGEPTCDTHLFLLQRCFYRY